MHQCAICIPVASAYFKARGGLKLTEGICHYFCTLKTRCKYFNKDSSQLKGKISVCLTGHLKLQKLAYDPAILLLITSMVPWPKHLAIVYLRKIQVNKQIDRHHRLRRRENLLKRTYRKYCRGQMLALCNKYPQRLKSKDRVILNRSIPGHLTAQVIQIQCIKVLMCRTNPTHKHFVFGHFEREDRESDSILIQNLCNKNGRKEQKGRKDM
ncbi:Uncharacterized protein TCM_000247 [Theobroma cacao]|uniref:Uncharacterized protein n=1 Tax=Theobroma cacao TaxID=3641 RepID=A0A061DGR0_THECC|nr:Uncharacterized protein TCM_000247 [Theobroma cacao]